MNDRAITIMYIMSMVVMGGCAAVTIIDMILCRGGAGFLPDTIKRIIGLVECAAIFMCVFSRCRGSKQF